MKRARRTWCQVGFLTALLATASNLYGQAAEELDEERRHIEMAEDAAGPLKEGALELTGGIASMLALATRYESIAVPGTFKPWEGLDLATAPDQESGDSNRLRENMRSKGWDCPTGYAAHHIVNKGDYSKNDLNYRALRDCLKRWDIDIDAAGNGVCMPKSGEAAATDESFPHRGREEAIHGPAITRFMLKECQSATSRKNMQNKLDAWRRDLTEGTDFWRSP